VICFQRSSGCGPTPILDGQRRVSLPPASLPPPLVASVPVPIPPKSSRAPPPPSASSAPAASRQFPSSGLQLPSHHATTPTHGTRGGIQRDRSTRHPALAVADSGWAASVFRAAGRGTREERGRDASGGSARASATDDGHAGSKEINCLMTASYTSGTESGVHRPGQMDRRRALCLSLPVVPVVWSPTRD
jgi:hypothetical protein